MTQFLTRAWWWLLGFLVFFTVFAFALNNRAVVAVHWFFGYESRIQLALLVLLTLMAGAMLGAVAMLPLWWRQYHKSRLAEAQLPGLGANEALTKREFLPASSLAGAAKSSSARAGAEPPAGLWGGAATSRSEDIDAV